MLEQDTFHDPEGWLDGGQDHATLQYRAVRDLWAMSQDGDEYGTLMASYFAAAEVLYLRTGESVDMFSPGLGLVGERRAVQEEGADPELDWPAAELWDWIDGETDDATRGAWLDALRDWCVWCQVEHGILEAAGKSY